MNVFRDRAEVLLAALLLGSLVLVTPRVGESDAVEYFSYLPSVLLDGDLDFEDEYRVFYEEDEEGRAGFKETFLDRSTPTGLKNNFGPIGTAVLWSPFYLATHAVVGGDGMGQPYRTAVTFASAIYAAIGLFLSYRLARRFAAPFVCFLAVVTLWWATPVAYYMYIAPGMSHAASLFAVALFLSLWPWATASQDEKTSLRRWALWGASAGLMALVREQDGLFAAAAFIVALRYEPPAAVKRVAAFGVAAFLVFVPQLVVYQILNGRPFPSSHVSGKMAWYSPHSLQVLFSPEHGLYFWSPILLVALAGAFLLMKRSREAGWVLLAGFLLQVYISGAVDSWTQAGAFGSRRFVNLTPVFAVWLALAAAAALPKLKPAGLSVAAGLFVAWNLSLMMQFGLGLMNRDHLVWREVVYNTVYEVPPRFVSVLTRYLSEPEALAGSAKEDSGS